MDLLSLIVLLLLAAAVFLLAVHAAAPGLGKAAMLAFAVMAFCLAIALLVRYFAHTG